ncbi:MAG: ComEC/Rec2 family competence protein [Flavobacteriaceae bacterium]|nr:ComEC/Rec2 family competence protein [Flavobacteriaceae bacterium]
MNKQPLLICVICFALGIIFQDFNQFNIRWVGAWLLLGIFLLILGFIKKLFFDQVKSLFLAFFFFSSGMFFHFLNSPQKENFNFPKNKTQYIVFQLNKKLNSNEKNKRYEVKIFHEGKAFSAVMAIPKDQKELDFLHFYTTKAYINPTEKPQHDFLFDYQKYLARQDIHYQTYTSNELLTIPKEKINFSDQIKQHRLNLLNKIDSSSVLKPKNKAFLKGIILADRTEINKETIDSFSQTGLIHILAISGSHMAVIFMLISSLLKAFFSAKYRYFPIFLSLFAIWGFAIFINFGNSVLRSCIMISVYYMMFFLQRKPNLPHAMALAGMMILFLDTHQLFNIGFQLSFLAVLGIYWLNRPIVNIFGKVKNKILKFFVNSFALSTSAQVSVAPLTLYYFHHISIFSVFINVASILFAQMLIVFSFIICVLFSFNIAFDWILTIYDFCSSQFLNFVKLFAQWDFSYMNHISMEIPEVITLLILVYFTKKIIINPNVKNALNFSYLTLLFVFIRIFTNIYFWQKDEVLSHQFFQHSLVSVKQGDKTTFYISDKTDIIKIQQYIITPYSISRRIKDIEIITQKTNKRIINNKEYEIK